MRRQRTLCWTYSHHCQIADKNPSKRWDGEFRGIRICVGWISTTGFCVCGFLCARLISLLFCFYFAFILCFSFVSLVSLFSGYHAEGYHAPSIPHGLSRPYHHCTAITPVYISRLSRHRIFLLIGYHTRAITLHHTRNSGYHTRHS